MKELDFLKRIRERKAAADRPARRPHPGQYPEAVRTLTQDLVAEFRQQLTAVGGHVYLVDDAADARVQLRDIVSARQLKQAALSGHLILRDLELDSLLQRLDMEIIFVTGNAPASPVAGQAPSFTVAEADLGLTGTEYAVAASGTLVMAAAPHHARTVSLLPPVHVAIVRQAQLLPDLAALSSRLQGSYIKGLPSGLALVTGPSRSADIEQTLTIGAHGPGELHVLLLSDGAHSG